MPNPLTIADAGDLVDAAIQKIVLKDDRVESRFFEQYYNTETGVSDFYLKDSSLSGIGSAGRIIEGGSVVSQSPTQGYDKTYTQVRQGVLLTVTWEMWRFGIQKRKLTAIVEQTRKAVETLREELCAARVDNGYSTSYTVQDPGGNYAVTITGGDGVALTNRAIKTNSNTAKTQKWTTLRKVYLYCRQRLNELELLIRSYVIVRTATITN